MANPTLLSRLLCADADKNTIPDTDAGTAGVFSQQYGWQAINSLPLSAGGKAVQRQDFNGVFNLLGGIAFYAQKGYTWIWDNSQDYVVGCIVIDPNDGKRYECISDVTANATSPSADTTHWKTYGEVDISGKANVTLDNLDTANLSVHVVVDSYYDSGTGDWYRVYDDNWVEQGGVGVSGGGNTISYLKPYSRQPFVQMSPLNNYSSYLNACLGNAISTTTTGFTIVLNSADNIAKITSSISNIQCAWFACGMGLQP